MFNEKNENLLELLKDFYNITKMKVCIFDADGEEVLYYPYKFTNYCKILRNNETINKKCIECDKRAFEICKKTKKAYIYTCHVGLTECFAPVLLNDKITAYIAIGQIRKSTSKQYIPKNKKNIKALNDSFNELSIESDEKINSAINILETCVGYDKLQKYIIDSQIAFKIKIESCIKNNLKTNLNIETLCSYMKTSRIELYRQIKEIYDLTPAELVKKTRILHAQHLLSTTKTKISSITEECGLGDYNYFSKIFKKETKISPREYRKKNFS